jgi:hypothetical protein
MLMVIMSVFAVLLLVGSAQAADPKSLLELLSHVPDPPTTAQEAGSWFAKETSSSSGMTLMKLVQSKLIAVKADIESSKKASETMLNSAGEALSGEPARQGMENSGIDVARMQKDPAYQREMEKKIQKLPMQEQMALMKQLMAPQMQMMQQDAMAGTQESSAVQAAVEAAKMAQADGNSWYIGRQAEVEKELGEVNQIMGKAPMPGEMPKIPWDEIACNASCDKQWQAYAEKAWPVMLTRETERLQARRAILQRFKSELVERLQDDKLVVAAQFGKGARSQMNRSTIGMHYLTKLDYIRDYADVVERTTKDSAAMVHRGARENILAWSRGLTQGR